MGALAFYRDAEDNFYDRTEGVQRRKQDAEPEALDAATLLGQKVSWLVLAGWAVLCCAVLCCAVLRCAALLCAVLCYAEFDVHLHAFLSMCLSIGALCKGCLRSAGLFQPVLLLVQLVVMLWVIHGSGSG